MVALVDGVPRTLNLVQALQAYIDHQVEVITRRSQFRLARRRSDRAHILEGSSGRMNVIDEVIALIRASEDRAAARDGLMAGRSSSPRSRPTYILDMQLGQLTRLARIDLEAELDEQREAESPSSRRSWPTRAASGTVIKDELLASRRSEFATPRLAELTHDVGEIADSRTSSTTRSSWS